MKMRAVELTDQNEFKETELGFLPKDWDIGELGDVTINRKETIDPHKIKDQIYVGLEHMPRDSINIKAYGNPSDVRSTKNVFYKGDILYGKLRPYLNKVILSPEDGISSTDIIIIIPKRVNRTFLAYFMKSKTFLDFAVSTMSGVNHPRTSWNKLKVSKIPLPPDSEQKKIAFVLSRIRESIEKTENAINAYREMKKSLMKHLFTYGPVSFKDAENVKLKETEMGEIPEDWNIDELGNIADISYGIQAAVAHLTDERIGIPILTNVNITNYGKLDLSILRYYELHGNKRDKLLKGGDILFNWRSGSQHHIGKTAIFHLEGDYTFSSFILRFRVKRRLLNSYLFYFLKYLKDQGYFALRRDQSSVNKVFNASRSAKILVAIPSLHVQQKIASILSAVDEKIEKLENKKKALEELFKSMLHNLMTAKIRVKGLGVEDG